ncbi:MAG: hypothetical protein RJA35_883, partial [Actinomycetota bacterium]
MRRAICASETTPVFSFTGFRDGHIHPLFASRESAGPDVSGLDAAGIVDAV